VCVLFLGLMKNNVLQNSDVNNSLTKKLGNLVAIKFNLRWKNLKNKHIPLSRVEKENA
jgi:hypothetical protein